jgi:hypothetical protein
VFTKPTQDSQQITIYLKAHVDSNFILINEVKQVKYLIKIKNKYKKIKNKI